MAKKKEPKQPTAPFGVWAPAVGLAWLIPGGGHLLLKRTGRGVLLMLAIAGMFLCGLMMRGAMFQPQSGDILTILINTGGFIGDVASGICICSACGSDMPSPIWRAPSTITAPSFWSPPGC